MDIQRKSANLIEIEYSGRVTAKVLATKLLAVANTRSAQGNAVRKVGGYLKEATRTAYQDNISISWDDKAGHVNSLTLGGKPTPYTYRLSGGVPIAGTGKPGVAQVNHPQGGAREYIFQRAIGNSFKTGDTSVTQDSLPSIGSFEGAALKKGTIHVHMWSNRAEGADPDYLTFGYWLDSTSFGAFSMGAGGGWSENLSGGAGARFQHVQGIDGQRDLPGGRRRAAHNGAGGQAIQRPRRPDGKFRRCDRGRQPFGAHPQHRFRWRGAELDLQHQPGIDRVQESFGVTPGKGTSSSKRA